MKLIGTRYPGFTPISSGLRSRMKPHEILMEVTGGDLHESKSLSSSALNYGIRRREVGDIFDEGWAVWLASGRFGFMSKSCDIYRTRSVAMTLPPKNVSQG